MRYMNKYGRIFQLVSSFSPRRVYLLPRSFFIPLPISPDKKRYYHYDVDDHAYRKKAVEMLALMSRIWLLCMHWIGFTRLQADNL